MVAGATPLPTASLPLWQPPQPYMGTKLVLNSRIMGLKTSVGPGISAQPGLYYRVCSRPRCGPGGWHGQVQQPAGATPRGPLCVRGLHLQPATHIGWWLWVYPPHRFPTTPAPGPRHARGQELAGQARQPRAGRS